ncbi:MAG: adenosylcobinamide-GDP ribazoletransferase, partial [Gammaproteobacteria bacterium]
STAARRARCAHWYVGGVALFDYGMIVPLLVAGAIAVGLRKMVRCRLGGSTGDTLGASCEIVEATVLLTAALAVGHING